MYHEMFRSARNAAFDVGAELRLLPESHTAFELEGAWLVVGPTGLFVVAWDEDDLELAAQRAVRRADEVRSRLALELAWVPFVDALVFTSHPDGQLRLPCIAVPATMMRSALAEGPPSVDDDTLARLRELPLQRLG
jgi:hypothetical protein